MKFFVDTADVESIRDLVDGGFVDGVTTTPELISATGRPVDELVAEICEAVEGPVSVDLQAGDCESMVDQGCALSDVAPNVAVKLPMTFEGLRACKVLTGAGRMVNVTLCFTAAQALLATKAGATFVSPFVGRLEDTGQDGLGLVKEIRQIYDNYGYETQILAASIRTAENFAACARIGIDVATAPPDVIRAMIAHELTDKALADHGQDTAAVNITAA
ncbi:putative transaldolase [Salipiger pallidus]|uniref:Putative transaldolase n=1 Tax=Salipiger pallidus TaxID=1775170 RepID=A0A8J3EGH1_9RHOB|nr:transaldolase family protein [Salipiger pallidus]GGG71419.1 putative transaldolase [Salipiger pallidus]